MVQVKNHFRRLRRLSSNNQSIATIEDSQLSGEYVPPKVSLCDFLYYFFVFDLIILQKINFFSGKFVQGQCLSSHKNVSYITMKTSDKILSASFVMGLFKDRYFSVPVATTMDANPAFRDGLGKEQENAQSNASQISSFKRNPSP